MAVSFWEPGSRLFWLTSIIGRESAKSWSVFQDIAYGDAGLHEGELRFYAVQLPEQKGQEIEKKSLRLWTKNE
jgi:hypothetical protein